MKASSFGTNALAATMTTYSYPKSNNSNSSGNSANWDIASHTSDETIILWMQRGVKEGKLDAVKGALKKLCELASTEEGCLTHSFAFNADETQVYATEIFANFDALFGHMKSVGEVLPEIRENTNPVSLTITSTAEDQVKLKELLPAFPITFLTNIDS